MAPKALGWGGGVGTGVVPWLQPQSLALSVPQGAGLPSPLAEQTGSRGCPDCICGELHRRGQPQRTVPEQIRAVSIHLFSNAPCLVWAMWGLLDKGRATLIEFTGSLAVHRVGGRAGTLPRDPLSGRKLRGLGSSSR